MSKKVIFITGASKGLGKEWAKHLLEQGYKVVATVRNTDSIKDLAEQYPSTMLPLNLDVRDRKACYNAIAIAKEHFGRIDVLISNAGYGHYGTIEELTEEEIHAQMATNFYGSLWIIQAVLPIMRGQQSGHILQVSSVAGVVTYPGLGAYHASKWAIEGICDSLSQEVKDLGIKVTIVEPGAFSTDFGTNSKIESEAIGVYDTLKERITTEFGNMTWNDPKKSSPVMIKIIEAGHPPLRVILGEGNHNFVEGVYNERIRTWKEWEAISTFKI